MRPNRHQQNPGRYRGRVSAALLALSLTSALFVPALAQAGSATQQYTESPPSATGGNPTPGSNGSPSTGGSGGGSSQNQGASGASSGSGSPAAPVSGGGSGTSGAEQGSTSGGTGETGSGQGGSGSGGVTSGGSRKNDKTNNQPVAVSSGTPTSASTDDGGSSALVPILIAVAVLAALSIGAVLYRMRRANGAKGTEPGASAPRAG